MNNNTNCVLTLVVCLLLCILLKIKQSTTDERTRQIRTSAIHGTIPVKSSQVDCLGVFCKSSHKEPNSYWFSASITYHCHPQNKRYGMLNKPDNSGSLSEEISCFAIWNTRPFFGIRHVQPKTKINKKKCSSRVLCIEFQRCLKEYQEKTVFCACQLKKRFKPVHLWKNR